MQTPNRWLQALLIGVAAASPSAAHAGAWSAENQTIIGAVAGDRDQGRYYEADLYYERRLTGPLGVVSESHVQATYPYASDGWRGETQLAAKWAAWKPAHGALALQAGALWTYEPNAGCAGNGAEARVLAGRAVGEVFVNAEAAYRSQGESCTRGRFDGTLGWRPATNWLGLGQVFVDRDLSLGEKGRQTVKIQLSAVRFTSSLGGLQLGIRAGLGNAAGDRALVLGWWSAD